MVKEAEQHSEEDKKRLEKIELKHKAETLTYQAEKVVKDLGDKADSKLKMKVEEETANLKKAMESDNDADITKGIETLTNALSDLSKDVYSKVGAQQAQQQPGAENAQTGAGSEKKEEPKGDDDVIDAEYKVKE